MSSPIESRLAQSEEIRAQGHMAIMDLRESDGSFRGFGPVPAGFGVIEYGEGELIPENAGLWRRGSCFFVYDPEKIEVAQLRYNNANAYDEENVAFGRQKVQDGWGYKLGSRVLDVSTQEVETHAVFFRAKA